MASRKFRFVSPGVFLKEIDQSQLPAAASAVGPVIIGRTRKGPALKPYKVHSIEEFERIFGGTMPGNQGNDPWRTGTDSLAESYLPYAAKAYLSADIDSSVTVVRLAGIAGDSATSGSGEPGWDVNKAVGLFMLGSGSTLATASLGAVFYSTDADFGIKLKGVHMSSAAGTEIHERVMGQPVKFASDGNLTAILSSSSGTKQVRFSFGNIRDKFNTNPVLTNTNISNPPSTSLSQDYWLGETFSEEYNKFAKQAALDSQTRAVVAIPLAGLVEDFRSLNHGLTAARTGWIYGQDTGDSELYNVDNLQRLFRIIALNEGTQATRENIIAIENIRLARAGSKDIYGTFSVVVKRIMNTKLVEIERFDDCNLNPASQNFVSKRVGDRYIKWDSSAKRNRPYGSNPNVSEYIRIEMNSEIEQNAGPEPKRTVPFGFYGPIKKKTQLLKGTGKVFTGTGWISAVSGGINLSGAVGTAAASVGHHTASFQWPSLPIVHTASISGTRPVMFGASPFKQTWVNKTSSTPQTSLINEGYVDFLRKQPVWESVYEDQESGIASANSEYSSKFSLDEVVLNPKSGITVNQISSVSDVSSAVYVSGSRAGTTSSVATATITIESVTGISLGDTIKFIATDGTLIHATASKLTTSADTNSPTFQVTALLGGNPHAASQLASCLNANSRLTAIADDNKVVITQAVPGLAGNTAITLSSSTPTGAGVSAGILKTDFEGGANELGTAWSAISSNNTQLELRTLLDIVDGFHLPLEGGFDGVDITEPNPFNNRVVSDTATAANNYAYASIDRAIDVISDPETVEHNLAAMPGITNEALTTKLIRACESRGDSMAIIDLPNVYRPPFERMCSNFEERVNGTTPEATAAKLVTRQLNSSYGAAYYPWVKIRDEEYTKDVWVPPSVVALGVFAYTEQRDDVWFAPAGFNRGGLNTGNSGLPVLQASEQLLSRDRDTLYAANINPVAQFVSEGLVIFGQKTLQSTPSALDRINVRRLLIFVKKEVSRISNGLLFEQNVQATWKKFTNQVIPFLESVKVRFGLSDFKVVLDSTTTTPDLVDRNIMYAKVFLKPARSIEFIAVDFVITNTGASFAD